MIQPEARREKHEELSPDSTQSEWLNSFPIHLREKLSLLLQTIKTEQTDDNPRRLTTRINNLKTLKLAVSDPERYIAFEKVADALCEDGVFSRIEKLSEFLKERPFNGVSFVPPKLTKLLCGAKGLQAVNLNLVATTAKLLGGVEDKELLGAVFKVWKETFLGTDFANKELIRELSWLLDSDIKTSVEAKLLELLQTPDLPDSVIEKLYIFAEGFKSEELLDQLNSIVLDKNPPQDSAKLAPWQQCRATALGFIEGSALSVDLMPYFLTAEKVDFADSRSIARGIGTLTGGAVYSFLKRELGAEQSRANDSKAVIALLRERLLQDPENPHAILHFSLLWAVKNEAVQLFVYELYKANTGNRQFADNILYSHNIFLEKDLVDRLGDEKHGAEARDAIKGTPHKEIIEALCQNLSEQSFLYQNRAIDILEVDKGELATDKLCELASRHPDNWIRLGATKALTGRSTERVHDLLANGFIKTKDRDHKIACALALGTLSNRDEAIDQALFDTFYLPRSGSLHPHGQTALQGTRNKDVQSAILENAWQGINYQKEDRVKLAKTLTQVRDPELIDLMVMKYILEEFDDAADTLLGTIIASKREDVTKRLADILGSHEIWLTRRARIALTAIASENALDSFFSFFYEDNLSVLIKPTMHALGRTLTELTHQEKSANLSASYKDRLSEKITQLAIQMPAYAEDLELLKSQFEIEGV